MKQILALLAALAVSAATALAHDYRAGDLEIRHPASPAMLPGQPVGGGFLTVINHGDAADRLVAITSPVSGDVQLHDMVIENDVMKMRHLPDGIEIPAGATVELKPGGLHVMFFAPKAPFKEGDRIAATLTFEKAGAVDVTFNVEAPNGEDHSVH